LQTADGREIFFHRNALINIDFNKLEKGLEVNYLEEDGREGPQAKQITVRKRH
jgi:cold shock CspA family protein